MNTCSTKSVLIDIIVPGQANIWPRGSDVISNPQTVIDAMTHDDVQWIECHCGPLADLSPAQRIRHFATLEAAAPDTVARIVGAVYCAYYTTPEVQAVIDAIADAGPQEASPHFDETLLARIRQTTPGDP